MSSRLSTTNFVVVNNSHGHYGNRFIVAFSDYEEAKKFALSFIEDEREKAMKTNSQYGEIIYSPDWINVNILKID
jgi:RNA binding exosome subunit